MKIIEGVQYYTIAEVMQLVGRTRKTLTAWCKISDEREAEGLDRLIPAPKIYGNGNYRYWSVEDVEVIKEFIKNNKFKWGELKGLDPHSKK